MSGVELLALGMALLLLAYLSFALLKPESFG